MKIAIVLFTALVMAIVWSLFCVHAFPWPLRLLPAMFGLCCLTALVDELIDD